MLNTNVVADAGLDLDWVATDLNEIAPDTDACADEECECTLCRAECAFKNYKEVW